jgi:hypothetical protein
MPRVWLPQHVARLVTRFVAWLVVDYFAYAARPGASARRAACRAVYYVARRRLLCLRRASGCLGMSPGSSSTTAPRRAAHRAVRHATRYRVLRLHCASRTGSACRAACRRLFRLMQACSRLLRLAQAHTPHIRVPRQVARLVSSLVVDYFTYAARPGASAPRAAHHAARCRRLRLRHASGCLGTSRGSSCGSSSTTSTTPRVRGPRHLVWLVAWLVAPLVVDYFAYAVRPSASARHTARRTARRQLRLRRVSGCLGTSHGSSSTTPCAVTSSCGHTGSTSVAPCVATTCLVATLALLRIHRAPPRHRLLVASRRPFISTSFPN